MGQFFTDIAKSSRVGLILEVPGTEAFQKLLQSQAGADVMKFDGVRPGAIVIFEKGVRPRVKAWGMGRRKRWPMR